MARAKSAVLTPEEKKNILATVKDSIKCAKADNKVISDALKNRTKEHDKATKAYLAAQKADEKLLATGLKGLAKLEAELAGLSGVKAVTTE